METCHCERSEAIFSIQIASSVALLEMTRLHQMVIPRYRKLGIIW